jgi:allantoinase
MPIFDLIARNAKVATERGTSSVEIAVLDGRFVEISQEIGGSAREELDLSGQTVLPGAIDPHVHFNEPGRGDWEGWATGSAALAAGGATACFEMPLNALPPTLTGADFREKARIAARTSRVDFGLWGGLTPTNLQDLQDLAECGAIGFKAFMSNSGTEDFQFIDDFSLFEGMGIAASLGLPVAVHAENDGITSGLAAQSVLLGKTKARDYLASRPIVAELEAIGRALVFAEETGCALHIVHVSTGRGVAMIAAAQERGVDVSCETCPHYLVFVDDDVERIGALAKCSPPLRDTATSQDLWSTLLAGDIDMVSSDHSPALPAMKRHADFFAVWGGIAGCQHMLPALITAGSSRGLSLSDVVRLTSSNVARRFHLEHKGGIAVGNDADFSWGSAQRAAPIPLDSVNYRHPRSAWDNFPMTYRVNGTAVRGQVVFRDGHPVGESRGQLLKPERIADVTWPFDARD